MRLQGIQEFKDTSDSPTADSYFSQKEMVYSLFNKQVPLNIDYYALDESLSGKDRNLYTVSQYIGKESPLRFTEIENLPSFNFQLNQTYLQTFDFEEGGSLNIEGNLVLIQPPIEPKSEDFIVVRNSATINSLIFRVSKVEKILINAYESPSDSFNGSKIVSSSYKLSFFAYKIADEENLSNLKSQCFESLVFNKDLSEFSNKTLFSKKAIKDIESIDKLASVIRNTIHERFFIDKVGVLCVKLNDVGSFEKETFFLDDYINTFSSRKGLFSKRNEFKEVALNKFFTNSKDLSLLNKNLDFWFYNNEVLKEGLKPIVRLTNSKPPFSKYFCDVYHVQFVEDTPLIESEDIFDVDLIYLSEVNDIETDPFRKSILLMKEFNEKIKTLTIEERGNSSKWKLPEIDLLIEIFNSMEELDSYEVTNSIKQYISYIFLLFLVKCIRMQA